MDDVKKFTPDEIVAAIRHCVNEMYCTECVMYPHLRGGKCTMKLCAAAADIIEELHGIAPKKDDTALSGHWIYWDGWCGNHDRRIDDATCSVCGYKHPTVRATKEEWDTPKFLSDTCPGCGAKMKKGG